MSPEFAIALTGGIATGKSTVCNFLKMYGFAIIDADKIGHKVLNDQYKVIQELFGESYIFEPGKVDRKKLREYVFMNSEAKNNLEKLLHPLIYDEIKSLVIEYEKFKKPYIIDIPLFFETQSYNIKSVAVVYCSKNQQIKRLCERENIQPEIAQRMVNSQLCIEYKKNKATYLIKNDTNIKQLTREVEKFIQEVL